MPCIEVTAVLLAAESVLIPCAPRAAGEMDPRVRVVRQHIPDASAEASAPRCHRHDRMTIHEAGMGAARKPAAAAPALQCPPQSRRNPPGLAAQVQWLALATLQDS